MNPISSFLNPLVAEVTWLISALFGPVEAGVREIGGDPGRLNRIFVRGGYIEGLAAEDGDQAVYLTVVESAPLAAGLVAAVATAVAGIGRIAGIGRSLTALTRARPDLDRSLKRPDHARSRTRPHLSRPWTRPNLARVRDALGGFDLPPTAATDGFACLATLLFVFTYVTRLPIHAQVTVRYLLVVFPLAVYGLARIPALRRVVADRARLTGWTYAAGVLVGTQLFFVVYALREFGRGEAFQFHALVGLTVGAAFACCAVASVLDDRADPFTAVTGGLAAALGTNFVLLSGLVYFQYGPYALPLVDALAELLASA